MTRPPQQFRKVVKVGLGLAALIVILSPLLDAQVKAPSAILNQYRGQRTAWFTAVWPFANTLFGLLATIEFAWSAAVMLLEKSDMQSWTSALVRKLDVDRGLLFPFALWSLLDSCHYRQLRINWTKGLACRSDGSQ